MIGRLLGATAVCGIGFVASAIAASVALVLTLTGCWADFPDRVGSDARPPVDVGDNPPPADTTRPPRDGPAPLADTRPACQPGEFLSCKGKKNLIRCDEAGDVQVVDCTPYSCDERLERCDWCTPDDPDRCADANNLVTCTPWGMEQTVPCPQGCADGACL